MITGHELDSDTGTDYTYAEQRYMDTDVGRWISQDPAFLVVGTSELDEITQTDLRTFLSDPQALNSYSYTLNNPVKYVDEEGEVVFLVVAVPVILAAYNTADLGIIAYEANTIRQYPEAFSDSEIESLQTEIALEVVINVAGLASPFAGGTKATKDTLEALGALLDVLEHFVETKKEGDIIDAESSQQNVNTSAHIETVEPLLSTVENQQINNVTRPESQISRQLQE